MHVPGQTKTAAKVVTPQESKGSAGAECPKICLSLSKVFDKVVAPSHSTLPKTLNSLAFASAV
jgi:hypothetical protein